MGTFIVFYRFLFKLKTVQIQINPALESAEEIMDELVKVQRRVKFMSIVVVFGFLSMIMVTVIFSSLNLYQFESIRNIGAIINIVVCLPSTIMMIYFLLYFIKMGDDFVHILRSEYLTTLGYRVIIGCISIVIMIGWSNSVMIYVYLPVLQLIFNKPCTLEFLELAKKFLVFGFL